MSTNKFRRLAAQFDENMALLQKYPGSREALQRDFSYALGEAYDHDLDLMIAEFDLAEEDVNDVTALVEPFGPLCVEMGESFTYWIPSEQKWLDEDECAELFKSL